MKAANLHSSPQITPDDGCSMPFLIKCQPWGILIKTT